VAFVAGFVTERRVVVDVRVCHVVTAGDALREASGESSEVRAGVRSRVRSVASAVHGNQRPGGGGALLEPDPPVLRRLGASRDE